MASWKCDLTSTRNYEDRGNIDQTMASCRYDFTRNYEDKTETELKLELELEDRWKPEIDVPDRKNLNRGCDKVIIIAGEEFHVNSTLLATQSRFFENMFRSGMKESEDTDISLNLPGLTPNGFSDWLKEINSPKSITLTSNNVLEVLKVAHFTQSHWVLERCISTIKQFLRSRSKSFGIKVYSLAYLFDNTSLQLSTRGFVVENLAEALYDVEFQKAIGAVKLLEILQEKDLLLLSEEKLFLGILSWVNADVPAREAFLGDLLEHVQLYCVPPAVLKDNLYKDKCMMNKQCHDMYIDAMHCHAMPEMKAIRTRRTRYQRYSNEENRFLVTFKCDHPMYYEPDEDKWLPLPGLRGTPTGRKMKCVSTHTTIYVLVDYTELWQFSCSANTWEELSLPINNYDSEFDDLVYHNGTLYLMDNKRMWKSDSGFFDKWEECEPCDHNCTKSFSFGKYIIRIGRKKSGKKKYRFSCYDVNKMEYVEMHSRPNQMGKGIIVQRNSQSVMIIDGCVYDWYKWIKHCIKTYDMESGCDYKISQLGIPSQFKDRTLMGNNSQLIPGTILLKDKLHFVVGQTLFPHNGNSCRNVTNIKTKTIFPGEKVTAFVHLARDCFRPI